MLNHQRTAPNVETAHTQNYYLKRLIKVGFLYSAAYAMTGPARFTISEVAVGWQEAMVLQRKLRPYNWTRVMQLANTPPLQSTTPGLHPISIHQTSPLVRGSKHPITAYYSIYRLRKDERLSWPSWLTCSGWFTHASGHPSAAGRVQDRESSPAIDRRSTTVPRHAITGLLVVDLFILKCSVRCRVMGLYLGICTLFIAFRLNFHD